MTSPTAVGMKVFSAESLHWSQSAWNGTGQRPRSRTGWSSNPSPTFSPIFETGTYYTEGTGYLWGTSGDVAGRTQGVLVSYNAGGLSARGASATHGRRVFFGLHMNSAQQNSANSGLPVPTSDWFSPTVDLTPTGKTYLDQALNMALEPCVRDFGDHVYGSLAASTASQYISTFLRIGTAATDAEAADPSDANANKDNTTGTNDEDLTMPSFTVGTATNLVIPITQTKSSLTGTTYVNVFVDWNGDGDVADTNETQTVQTVTPNGTTNVTFSLTPPAGTTAGTKYLRIRTTEGTTAPTFAGASSFRGEVEDYAINVSADPSCYTVLLANSGAFQVRAYDGVSGADLGVRASGNGMGLASEIVAAPDGHVIVNNIDSGSTLKFNPYTGAFISTLIASGGPAAYASAVGTDGMLYLGDYSTSVVKRNVSTSAAAGTFISSSSPRGILVTGDGKFIVHEYATALKRYSAAGALEATVSSFASSESLALALGPDNNYYITNNETAKTIVRITPAGTRTTFATIAGTTRLFALAWGRMGICGSATLTRTKCSP